MKVVTKGEGKPEYAVVGGIHGDEPCGPAAIEQVLAEEHRFETPVKFVIANEAALAQDVRYLDTDLNRQFSADSSDTHEERLAQEVLNEVQGLKVLDIHATRSQPVPFITASRLNKNVLDLCTATGMERVAYFPDIDNTLHSHVDGIIVECGPQGTQEAEEMAHDILMNFLAAEDIIDDDYEQSDPVLYEHTDTVDGEGYTFTGTNFERVDAGEVFAVKDGEELRADEAFYPVLMSTDGYEHMIGHKSRKLGKLREQLQTLEA